MEGEYVIVPLPKTNETMINVILPGSLIICSFVFWFQCKTAVSPKLANYGKLMVGGDDAPSGELQNYQWIAHMSEKEIVDITDLKQDTRNANKGTERGQLMVNNSINENGAGRSVLVDRRGNIIAGNKTTRAATIAGLDVQIVRTDGTKLIAVMREDLDIDSPEARRLAIADNRTSEVGLEWDGDEFSALIADGVDVGGMFEDFELEEITGAIPDIDFKEYDEDIADEVEFNQCPECGHEWPK